MRSLARPRRARGHRRQSGEVAVDGHVVGRIEGLNLTIVESDLDADRRLLARPQRAGSAAGPAAQGGRAGRTRGCGLSGLRRATRSAGSGSVVARLRPGPGLLAPRLELTPTPRSTAAAQAPRPAAPRALARRLAGRAAGTLAARCSERPRRRSLSGAGRGFAYRLVEQLGNLRRDEAESLLPRLTDGRPPSAGPARGPLRPASPLSAAAAQARRHRGAGRLLRIFHGGTVPLPPAGRTVLRLSVPTQGEACWPSGFALSATSRCGSTFWSGSRPRIRAQARAGCHVRGAADAGGGGRPDPRRARASGRGAGLPAGARGMPARPAFTRPAIAAAASGRGGAPCACRTRRTRRSRCWPASGWRRERRRRAPSGQVALARALHPQPQAGGRWSPRGACALNEQVVGKTHQLVRPGDVITLTEPTRVRVLRVRALGERRGPAVEARGLYEELAGSTELPAATSWSPASGRRSRRPGPRASSGRGTPSCFLRHERLSGSRGKC